MMGATCAQEHLRVYPTVLNAPEGSGIQFHKAILFIGYFHTSVHRGPCLHAKLQKSFFLTGSICVGVLFTLYGARGVGMDALVPRKETVVQLKGITVLLWDWLSSCTVLPFIFSTSTPAVYILPPCTVSPAVKFHPSLHVSTVACARQGHPDLR